MLDNETIDSLTRAAQPLDFEMLRSYIRRGPSVAYVQQVMIPSLRRRHPTIWTRTDSKRIAGEGSRLCSQAHQEPPMRGPSGLHKRLARRSPKRSSRCWSRYCDC